MTQIRYNLILQI